MTCEASCLMAARSLFVSIFSIIIEECRNVSRFYATFRLIFASSPFASSSVMFCSDELK